MAVENMKRILVEAQKGHYAVGAFNIVDYNSMRAVVSAAEETSAPVIVQTSVKTVKFWGAEAIVAWLNQIAKESPVSVALHLDHCKEVDFCRKCIDAGWSSVMIDASSLPFEENLAATKRVVEMAEAVAVSVEAEMGEIGGVEEDIVVADEDAHLADPKKVLAFCREVELACFAPAIGTAHGVYKGEPKLDFERLETIAKQTGVPIALHGGTGLADDVFRKGISLGCAKINISTQIKYAFIDGFVDYHNENKVYEPLKPLGAQLERIKKEVKEKIELFGSAGKA